MKRKNIIPVLFITLLSVFVVSCKKDKDPEPRQAILGKWRITGLIMQVKENNQIIMTYNLYADLEDCEKDNIYEFRENNVLLVDEGATKCDPDDPQTYTQEYSLSNDGKKLTFFDIEWDIITLNQSSLKLRTEMVDESNTSRKQITEVTFTKQN